MARAELAPVIPLRAPVSGEDELSRLRRAVDLPRLIEVGYDPRAHIIRPHAEHPVFGYELCPVVHCTAAVERHALCEACWRRFRRIPGHVRGVRRAPARADPRSGAAAAVPGVPHRGSRAAGVAVQGVVQVVRCPAQGARPDGRRVRCWRRAASVVWGAAVGVATWRRSGLLACVSPVTGAGWPEASRICLSLRERACVVTASRRAKSISRRWASASGWRSSTRFKSSGWMVATPGSALAICRVPSIWSRAQASRSLLDELWMSSRDSRASVLPAAARPGRTAVGRSRARAFDGRVANGDPASRRRSPAD